MEKRFTINTNWDKVLDLALLENKKNIIDQERANETILPFEGEESGIYYALKLTDYDKVRVLIIGQDPYPNPEYAQGLAFSTKSGEIPDSLKNIFRKIKEETGIDNEYGNLKRWAQQGVLLLNTALTYKQGKSSYGFWKPVIINIIESLLKRETPLVIMLWGNPANDFFIKNKSLEKYLHKKNILLLQSSHPSNLGWKKETQFGSFYNCRHFSRCNSFLDKPIDWSTK